MSNQNKKEVLEEIVFKAFEGLDDKEKEALLIKLIRSTDKFTQEDVITGAISYLPENAKSRVAIHAISLYGDQVGSYISLSQSSIFISRVRRSEEWLDETGFVLLSELVNDAVNCGDKSQGERRINLVLRAMDSLAFNLRNDVKLRSMFIDGVTQRLERKF